eukprot:616894-Rhodomonas_salina.2
MRVTSTSFHEAGNVPVVRVRLTMWRIRSSRVAGRSRSTSFGMPSGPGALRRGSVLTMCRKSSFETSSLRWLS